MRIASGHRSLVMVAAVMGLALVAAPWPPAAAAADHSAATEHRVHCVLIGGHLYLGSAGATRHRRAVTCGVRFYQLTPHADGVIASLHGAGHHTSYSVTIKHLATPPTGRMAIRWINHPGPATLRCALIRHHLYLGTAGAGPRRAVTCAVRFLQLIPYADGVIVTLTAGRHKSSYSIAIKHLPEPPTGRTLIRWIA